MKIKKPLQYKSQGRKSRGTTLICTLHLRLNAAQRPTYTAKAFNRGTPKGTSSICSRRSSQPVTSLSVPS
ncbi:hypothetical protein EVA_20375 [gut metagenome]|uniref:Uncharacterized protein n=1 Tax=gut metagenome TaxID=749906 RepID=J9FPK4_9ZZZZ